MRNASSRIFRSSLFAGRAEQPRLGMPLFFSFFHGLFSFSDFHDSLSLDLSLLRAEDALRAIADAQELPARLHSTTSIV